MRRRAKVYYARMWYPNEGEHTNDYGGMLLALVGSIGLAVFMLLLHKGVITQWSNAQSVVLGASPPSFGTVGKPSGQALAGAPRLVWPAKS